MNKSSVREDIIHHFPENDIKRSNEKKISLSQKKNKSPKEKYPLHKNKKNTSISQEANEKNGISPIFLNNSIPSNIFDSSSSRLILKQLNEIEESKHKGYISNSKIVYINDFELESRRMSLELVKY